MRLLLVEDDPIIGDGLTKSLSQQGYAVDWINDGLLAAEALIEHYYELIVLDLSLPGKNGMDILKELRRRNDLTPVLILTARDTINERVYGLDTGADDFVVKPFNMTELYARLRALHRRQGGRATPRIEHQGIILDTASHTLSYQNKNIEVSRKEFEVLNFLLENKGRVISRARLEESLYGWQTEVESNAVEVHIHHLRKKLDLKLIRTVRGVGYIIDDKK